MAKIENNVIWITGASSGIGEALTKYLNTRSCKLIVSSRNPEDLQNVRNNCAHPENIEILVMDLMDHGQMPVTVKKAISFYGKIDILINNAGVSQRSLIAATELSVYKRLIDVNYLGTVALTKAILPHFITKKAGHFVTVTSLMGKFGSPYRSGYCGAKHALHGFFDVLRMEHQKDGLSVTLVCPGFIRTNVAKNALTGDGSKQDQEDEATKNGLPVAILAKRAVTAIEKKKFEVYIGRKEIMAVHLKRFLPKLLHKVVLKSTVR